MRITYTQLIQAPVDDVFALIDDDEKIKLWMDGLEETTYPDGRDRDNPVGTRFRRKLREGGRLQEYEGEVTAYEKPHHLGVRLGSPAFSVDVDYRLSPESSGTRLDYECRLQFATLFYRVMGFLFCWLTKSILRRQMSRLKQLAETGTAT